MINIGRNYPSEVPMVKYDGSRSHILRYASLLDDLKLFLEGTLSWMTLRRSSQI